MPNHEVSLNALDLIYNAGIVVKVIMLGLLFASVGSWAIILLKRQLLRQATRQNDAFLKGFWGGWNLSESFAKAQDYPFSPVAKSFWVASLQSSMTRWSMSSVRMDSAKSFAVHTTSRGCPSLGGGGRCPLSRLTI